MSGDKFLRLETIEIICLGLVAFAAGTAGGVVFGQIMRIASGQQDQPAHRIGRRIGCTDGSACIPGGRIERQPVQLLADAGDGAERSRGYWHCRSSRHHAGTVRRLISITDSSD